MLLAIILSFALMIVYEVVMKAFYPSAPPETAITQEASPESSDASPLLKPAPVITSDATGAEFATTTPTEVPGAKTVPIGNHLVTGDISNQGGRLVSLSFLAHRDKAGKNGIPIHFLTTDPERPHFAETGFLPGGDGVLAPERNKTLWQIGSDPSADTPTTEQNEVHLFWNNGKGLLFEKTYHFDPDSYLYTVTDQVVNRSGSTVSLFHFAQYVRLYNPPVESNPIGGALDFIGPMGYINDERIQIPYDDLKTSDRKIDNVKKGWVGFNDKYFLAALSPMETQANKRFYFDYSPPDHRVGVISNRLEVPEGKQAEVKYNLYIGPKEIRTLKEAGLELGRSIDYGWFHFLAVPLVQVLMLFKDVVHNFGVAIIMLTILIKLLFFPLANKSYRSMNAMKKLQPKIEQLKALHGKDKGRLNQEMMKLYQENKVNPLGGCLPMLIQIPVFFALYKVLLLSVEMRHSPFLLWITDLSTKDPYYVLPLLMGASMWFQSKLNPAPADPMQAKVMMFLPLIFTVMFLQFPAGLVLYWLLNNVLSILQQTYISRKA
jgi:YidC/Oxa1 family membrane protein insertase